MSLYWMLETPTGDTITVLDSNISHCDRDLDSRGFFTESNDSTGSFFWKNNKMVRCQSGGNEGIGTFKVI